MAVHEAAGNPTTARRPALRLVKTQDMDRQEWLAIRNRGIGSSDAAAAVGLNPYKSQLALWMEKAGRAPQAEAANDEDSPTYWGTLLEPIVAAHYTRRTGNRVRRINAVLQHPSYPWMLANIDREILGGREVHILECKTAGLNGARLWSEGVPEYVQLQVMHQLAVTGKAAADVAVLICGQELRIHRIERDEELIGNLITLEQAFWQHVEQNAPPPADGSDSADQALRALYPADSGATRDLRGEAGMNEAFAELVAVRQQLAEAARREAQLKQLIAQRMGECSRAVFDGGEVSWKRSKDSRSFDLARLLKEHPQLATQYALTVAGTRRFLVNT